MGVFHAWCTVAWTLAPYPFLSVMNSLFHGMDFSSMVRPAPFDWLGFFTALLVLCAWALLAKTFFAWLPERLTR